MSKPLAKYDPFGWGVATRGAGKRAAGRPAEVASAAGKLVTALAQIPVAAAGVATGVRSDQPPVPIPDRDRRFADPAWEDNAIYWGLRQYYLAWCRFIDEMVEAGSGGGTIEDQKNELLFSLIKDGLAPTNFPLTNPDVLITAFRTGGRSLLGGVSMATHDLIHNNGRPMKVDRSKFELGKDLAVTPGKVIYRNEMMELIQYAPQTEEVHAVPLLASPAWINKYYVMDLAPGRSFFEWAIKNKRTLFTISYRNPDESMQDVTMDDYAEHGPLKAIEVIKEITGSDKVDIVGLCLGGALTAMTAAYLSQESDVLGTVTITNTLLDYSSPGILGTLTDPQSLDNVDAKMRDDGGFLNGRDMAVTFDLLRANDLIFNYVVSRWMKGEAPNQFDILAWNDDSTNMPAAMHSAYLRSLYQNNELAKGEYVLKGRKLNLGDIKNDAYVVGAINDHIVPWEASYRSAALLGGKVRYALSSGGHIAGIVNPPNPKAWYEANEDPSYFPDDPKTWADNVPRHKGSWWEDWAKWSSERAGELVKPPKMGSRKYKPLEDAPGTYVLAQV